MYALHLRLIIGVFEARVGKSIFVDAVNWDGFVFVIRYELSRGRFPGENGRDDAHFVPQLKQITREVKRVTLRAIEMTREKAVYEYGDFHWGGSSFLYISW